MYILIGGGGQVGFYLTKGLRDQGHEVLLLERDARRAERLTEELGTSVIRGDACEARVLQKAGCERAELVIAVTGDDEDNLVLCQVAKHRFKVKMTVARVNNPNNDKLFRQLGIDVTVSPTRNILNLIESQIPHHTLVPLITLNRAGLNLVEVTVPSDSEANHKTIRALNLPLSVNIALITRTDQDTGSEQNITTSGDTMLQEGDRIFALATAEGEQALRALILGEETGETAVQ